MDLWWVNEPTSWLPPLLAALVAVVILLGTWRLSASRSVGAVTVPSTRKTITPRVIVASLLAILALPIVVWFLLAAFVTGTGCLWVIGIGGCVPWVPGPTTI